MKLNSKTNQSNNRPATSFTKHLVLTAWFSVVVSLAAYLGLMHGYNVLQ